MRETFETWICLAEVRLRPAQAPEPSAAHQRRPRAGAATRPMTGTPSSTRAIRVAHTGTPRDEVVGAVDRVDDPLPRAGPGGRELLADDGVARPGALELGADQLLGVAVGVADQGEVGLGVDPQVLGAEPRGRDALDGIREHVGEAQVVVVAGHGRPT